MESRETREKVSRQLNKIEFSTRMHTNVEEHVFYRAFDRNRPIKMINGYDGTVHRGPFQISRGCPIMINGPDES